MAMSNQLCALIDNYLAFIAYQNNINVDYLRDEYVRGCITRCHLAITQYRADRCLINVLIGHRPGNVPKHDPLLRRNDNFASYGTLHSSVTPVVKNSKINYKSGTYHTWLQRQQQKVPEHMTDFQCDIDQALNRELPLEEMNEFTVNGDDAKSPINKLKMPQQKCSTLSVTNSELGASDDDMHLCRAPYVHSEKSKLATIVRMNLNADALLLQPETLRTIASKLPEQRKPSDSVQVRLTSVSMLGVTGLPVDVVVDTYEHLHQYLLALPTLKDRSINISNGQLVLVRVDQMWARAVTYDVDRLAKLAKVFLVDHGYSLEESLPSSCMRLLPLYLASHAPMAFRFTFCSTTKIFPYLRALSMVCDGEDDLLSKVLTVGKSYTIKTGTRSLPPLQIKPLLRYVIADVIDDASFNFAMLCEEFALSASRAQSNEKNQLTWSQALAKAKKGSPIDMNEETGSTRYQSKRQ